MSWPMRESSQYQELFAGVRADLGSFWAGFSRAVLFRSLMGKVGDWRSEFGESSESCAGTFAVLF